MSSMCADLRAGTAQERKALSTRLKRLCHRSGLRTSQIIYLATSALLLSPPSTQSSFRLCVLSSNVSPLSGRDMEGATRLPYFQFQPSPTMSRILEPRFPQLGIGDSTAMAGRWRYAVHSSEQCLYEGMSAEAKC